jgi:hypothetical protein
MRIEPAGTDERVARVQAALAALADALVRGDVRPKQYGRRRQDLVAEMGRCKVAAYLEPGEAIVAEHHWIEPPAEASAFPLRETPDVAGSAYATDRRVFRWRFLDPATPHVTSLEGFDETFECLRYDELAGLVEHRTIRWGEAAVGTAIAAIAWLLRLHLQLSITGPALLAVGAFGLVHALVRPTRHTTLMLSDPAEAGREILAANTATGRRLVEELRRRIPSSAAGSLPLAVDSRA